MIIYIWINILIKIFLIQFITTIAIIGEKSIPILKGESIFLNGAKIGSVNVYNNLIY